MTRLISGVALASAALAAILFLPPAVLRIVACLVAALATREYVSILHRDGKPPDGLPLVLLAGATCWVMSGAYFDLLPLVVLALGWVGVEVLLRGQTVDRAAARVLAMWYIGMPLGMLAAVNAQAGSAATLFLIATIVVSDSAQYYVGRTLGRRPLAPTISPKKTIEGAAGGVVLGTLFVVIAGSRVFGDANPIALAGLGIVLVILGIAGDLFESRMKRIAGVKDSSSLIPGHGGILDRIDALLFATPAFYLYLQA